MRILTPSLRSRLSRIARGMPVPSAWPVQETPGRAGSGAAPPAAQSPVPDVAAPFATPYDPTACGVPVENEGGTAWAIEVPLSTVLEDYASRCSSLSKLPPGCSLMVDIETAGLAGAPLFLIGTLELTTETLTLRQFLARDYSEEPSVIRAFTHEASSCTRYVTYNGRTFDLPYIDNRSLYHGLSAATPASPLRPHHDLLPVARRRWKGSTPNCKLQTLETAVLGRRRLNDVPGSAIATLYHEYVRTGNWETIAPVLQHNAMDLLTLGELWVELSVEAGAPGAAAAGV